VQIARSLLLALTLIAGAAFSFVAYRFLHEEYVVDECLSGRHGSFDYTTMSCDLEENHSYISYWTRHPHDELTALTALVSFALFLSGYVYLEPEGEQAPQGTNAKADHRD